MKKLYTAKPVIDDAACDEVMAVLRSGNITQGEKVAQLEKAFADFAGVKYSAVVNSGTAALHCALFALDIGPGDEVITTPFTFAATANAILMVGAKPVFVDIEPDTYNIDPSKIEAAITPNTKAIMPVHLFGLIADMNPINDIAKQYDLKVIEDASQAHGATYWNSHAGGLGDIGTFSLYATKNLMAAEGGIVTSNNKAYIDKIKSFRHHGQEVNGVAVGFGFNYRMSDIHAVIGLNQLTQLTAFNSTRRRNAALYDKGLATIDGIKTPFVPQNAHHVYHQYSIAIDSNVINKTKNEFAERLASDDIFAKTFYETPLHMLPVYQAMGGKEGDFPVAESTSKSIISLPVHPSISEEDVLRTIEAIKKISEQ